MVNVCIVLYCDVCIVACVDMWCCCVLLFDLYRVALSCIMLCCLVLRCIVLNRIVSHCVVLYCRVVACAVL